MGRLRRSSRIAQGGRITRGGWIALGGIGLLLALGSTAFAPFVRARVERESARRGIVATVDGVWPGWFSVHLSGVHAKLEGVDGVRVDLDDVWIELSPLLSLRGVRVQGGQVGANGAASLLADALTAWRDRHGRKAVETSLEKGADSPIPLHAEGLSLTWDGGDDGQVRAEGVSVARDVDALRFEFSGIDLRRGALAASLAEGGLALNQADIPPHASIHTVKISWLTESAAPSTVAAPPASSSLPAPPPVPSGLTDPPLDVKHGPLAQLPNLHAWRQRIAAAASLLAQRVPNEASFQVERLSFQIQQGTEALALGPGPFAVSRRGEWFDAEFVTSRSPGAAATSKGSSLSFNARIPVNAGANDDVRISMSGGPLPLSMIGVQEGALGVTDVHRAELSGQGEVVLSGSGDALTLDVNVGVRQLGLKQPKIAADPLHGLDMGFRVRGLLTDHGELRLDDAEASLGALRLRVRGTLDETDDFTKGALSFDVPVANCQTLFDSVPSALLPDLHGSGMAGTFAGRGEVAFDSRDLNALVLRYDIDDLCKLVRVPEALEKGRFRNPFMHRIYLPDGAVAEEETGPGSVNWSDLPAISPYMQVAVLTTEDAGFYHHRGFNHPSIRGSVIANLKARRFVRGASTITMQLAKNLFLAREKTLSRKLEEVILTDYLEQNFTKEEIMELYLNVIEFGPKIYGITAAADYYFGRKPEELLLSESFFLATLLPRPLVYAKAYERGAVSESWMRSIHQLMNTAFKTGKISQPELNEGLAETILFHPPDTPRPPPRLPIGSSHFLGDDNGWEPLD